MGYSFQNLEQLVDKRGKLPHKGSYTDYGVNSKTTRVWHHSLTKKALAGSVAEAFASFHVSLGWPGVAYHFIIEPQNTVTGKDGRKRARIVWAQNVGAKSYHVGNSNKFALGVCVAGDYRSEKLDEPTLLSISELHAALVKDGIGSKDKSHNEMPGYSWKDCCMYDYRSAVNWQGKKVEATEPAPDPAPGKYTIQEGDTFWSIALKDGKDGITVNDLIVGNPGVDPGKLSVGQVINFGAAQNSYTPTKQATATPTPTYKYPLPDGVFKTGSKGDGVKQIQTALNAILFKCGEPDGKYGPKTADAVSRFQKVYLPYAVDGIYGDDTRRSMQAVLKSKGY